MNKLFAFVSSASVFALVACAGADGSTPGDTSDDGVEGLKVACGGIAGIKCPTGYQCISTSHIPDAMGTCKKKKSCIQTQLCTLSSHWDSKKCACVPNSCVENVMCIKGDHWDSTLCSCVPDYTCEVLECSSSYHCEMKGLNGGSTAVCIHD